MLLGMRVTSKCAKLGQYFEGDYTSLKVMTVYVDCHKIYCLPHLLQVVSCIVSLHVG